MQTAEAIAIFRNNLYRRYGERSTPKHYLSDLRIFLRQLSDTPVQHVTAQEIDRFIDAQRQQGLAASTINRRLATLHTFFECLAAFLGHTAPDQLRQPQGSGPQGAERTQSP